MREFASLYADLDATTSTHRKLECLKNYLATALPENAAWAVYFLAGGKPRQIVPRKLLRQSAISYAAIDEWLFDESYNAVGDLAETIALIIPSSQTISDIGLAEWIEARLLPLRNKEPSMIENELQVFWKELATPERFLLTKLISGGLRVGVSRALMIRALASLTSLDVKRIAQRLIGWATANFYPTAETFTQLIQPETQEEKITSYPFPFFLAHAFSGNLTQLGSITNWQVEWKYDGIRAQLVYRGGISSLWSRGEELITDRFPELCHLPLPEGTVIDGEILVWEEMGTPAPFALLQKRITRKTVSSKLMKDFPIIFMVYDLLEHDGEDIRVLPQATRRQLLEKLLAPMTQSPLKISPLVVADNWEKMSELQATSRQKGVEGVMLKEISSQYGVGRTKNTGIWWKWKITPYTIDAVLIYAQAGHGRRASLYTDYTFAVWDENNDGKRVLVPFAKAYSGLTDKEIIEVDRAIRKDTIEKFGPVRSVEPTMVFELAFEGLALSSRHKSGIAVRFPRILRWRKDKTTDQADTLDNLKNLLP